MNEPTVACVGLVVLDRVLEIETQLTPGSKHFATRFEESCGGPAATAAATVVALGGRARLYAQVGTDETASKIMTALDRAGIDRRGVHHIANLASSVSTVVVSGGDRTIINHTPPEILRGAPTTDVVSDEVGAVLTDARWPEGAGAALRDATISELPAILDLDATPDAEAAAWLTGLASHVVASRAGAGVLMEQEDPAVMVEALAHFTDGPRAVTDGAAGVWWSDGGDVHHLAAPRVAAVESVGAGDVFHGALALALARRRSFEAALQYASAAAALRCTRRGGWAAIPSGYDVDRLVEHTWT
jgi:sulfofructose kinase